MVQVSDLPEVPIPAPTAGAPCTCNALPVPHYHNAAGIQAASRGAAPDVVGAFSGSTL
jgi:hypothetical protein